MTDPQEAARIEQEMRKTFTPSPIMRYFEYKHLPEHLQGISGAICETAKTMDAKLQNGAEKSAGLRKLLEAKDCFVRANI